MESTRTRSPAENFSNEPQSTPSLRSETDILSRTLPDFSEKAIKDAKEVSEEDILQSLKKSQEEYRQELQCAEDKKNEVEGRLNELKSQEQTFIEFKL